MSYHGDIRLGDTIDVKFCTVATTGAPTTLAGSPVVSAYVGNGTTEITAGITLTVDFDSRTGMHNVRVVASSGNGFATATNVQLVITTGTVGGTSVVGYVIGEFSIENRSALMPTTAARTLDVTAANKVQGVVLVDTLTTYTGDTPQTGDSFARIGAPAGASVSADVAAVKVDTAAILVDTGTTLDARIPAALVGGRMDASVGAIAANAITAASMAADAGAEIADAVWDEVLAGHAGAGSAGEALSAAGTAGDPWTTALPGAYGAGTAGKIVGDNLNATISSRATPAQVATELATYDGPTFAEMDARTDAIDAALVALQADTDNLQTRVPAALVGGRMDSSVGAMALDVLTAAALNADAVTEIQSGLATAAALTVVDDFLDTEIAAIKAKTDLIPAAPAAVGDIPTATQNADALLKRDMSAVTGEAARSPLNALRKSMNKVAAAAGTLTVYKEDDTAAAFTQAIGTDAAAVQIVSLDTV